MNVLFLPRLLLASIALGFSVLSGFAAEIAGTSVVPHGIVESMRYRSPRDPDLAARVQVFVKGPAGPARFDGRTPAELLATGEWAWHDFGTAVRGQEGALTVWSFNGRTARWGTGQSFDLAAEGLGKVTIPVIAPQHWISAATFLSSDESLQPDTIVLHVANESAEELKATSLRFWLPKAGTEWQVLWPQNPVTVSMTVPPGEKGFIRLRVPKLPLTFTALELGTTAGPLWAHLRIKRETFDISGGWVNDSLVS